MDLPLLLGRRIFAAQSLPGSVFRKVDAPLGTVALPIGRCPERTRGNAGLEDQIPTGFGIDYLHASRTHSRVSSRDSPVSKRLLRLARMCGQPLDTAWMNFEPSLSIS